MVTGFQSTALLSPFCSSSASTFRLRFAFGLGVSAAGAAWISGWISCNNFLVGNSVPRGLLVGSAAAVCVWYCIGVILASLNQLLRGHVSLLCVNVSFFASAATFLS